MKYPFFRFPVFSFSRLLIFTIAATLFVAQSVSAQVVDFPDPNLESAIRESLNIPDGNPITQQEILRLTRLEAWESGITDLAGLEYATNLESLDIWGNQISNIRPLTGLTHLTTLGLFNNPVEDITPLASLTNLTHIDLADNAVETLDPLAGLIQLQILNLSSNRIEDITPLANLTELMELTVSHNQVTDVSPLAGLTGLTFLNLRNNRISDLNPLANLTALETLRLDRNAITDIAPLAGLKNLIELWLAENPIHNFSPLAELEGVELDLEIDLSRLDELNLIVEILDPNLRRLIRETLSLPEAVPLTQGQMLRLTRLDAGGNRGINDLTGLEYATNLQSLGLYRNPIVDISPLAHLTKLEGFNLWGCGIVDLSPLRNLKNLRGIVLGNNKISDISPLAELTNLTFLQIHSNQIVDFSPLANLINLRELWINDNFGTDISSLHGLSLTDFRYDEPCDIKPLLPPVRERIESRSFPSVFQAWDGVVGLDHLTSDQQYALHDLHWSPFFGLGWRKTAAEPTYGVATSLSGNLARADEIRQQRLDQNPNMVFLVEIRLHNHFTPEVFPPNSDFWLRDAQGQIIRNSGSEYLINFLKPEVQDLLTKRIIAVARCGLYDGVLLDGFHINGIGFAGRHLHSATDEEIIQAMLNIFRSVRSQVRDDFLILVNANRTKATRYTEYVNGTFMETGSDNEYLLGILGGYTHDGLKEIESTLLWSEENLRSPQINCLEGWGIPAEPPDSPENRRWMRVFTTMSLILSDGYVMYNTGTGAIPGPDPDAIYPWGPGHEHWWYPFWDADLGRPVGPQAQLYQNIEGLFIREFTNGWAVYNRSGKAQTITLPASATPVSDRGGAAASQLHLLPDLDGEMYLKGKNPADVNGDGKINILDLVQVANGFGKSTPDPNGDGAVNILDLVFVAQQLSQ